MLCSEVDKLRNPNRTHGEHTDAGMYAPAGVTVLPLAWGVSACTGRLRLDLIALTMAAISFTILANSGRWLGISHLHSRSQVYTCTIISHSFRS